MTRSPASDKATATHFVELPILYETIRDLTSTLSIHQVVERLLERVLVHLDSEIASILLPGADGMLRISHARGLPAEVIERTCLAAGDAISGYVFATATPLLIADVESDTRFSRRNHERYYTKSAMSVPLLLGGRPVGVLNINNKRTREAYSEADFELVQAIGGHAAVALCNARRFEETLDRAQRDSLTGLANHGHFWSTADVEVQRACRYGRELALVVVDVDHFKEFNDRFGHRAGDRVLAGVAGVIAECARAHDFAARYGGEEFAVLLPETTAEGGAVFAERLRAAVESKPFFAGNEARVTVSGGVAACPADAREAAALVEVADERLYRAKAAGRNRVCA